MKKILGMGNAIVDVVTFIESDSLLERLQLPKGSMQLIGNETIEKILLEISDLQRYMVTGGSASNTVNGVARLGLKAGFIGKIGRDEVGEFFKSDSQQNGVRTHLQYSSDLMSGQCFSLVSPDSERTMCTFLGAACELMPEDLDEHAFGGYDYFHIEGYLVQNHELIAKAVRLAKQQGLRVSLDLASYNVVEENLQFLQNIIRDYIDIVFANEDEARILSGGLAPQEALNEIAKIAGIVVVNCGNKGSLIKFAEKQYMVEANKVNPIDTTGAGDLFASGFLFGLMQDYPIDICGRIGTLTAGNVVEVVGAKMENERWERIHKGIKQILGES